MKPGPAASLRFRSHVGFAITIGRRWSSSDDMRQNALLGLHQADTRAPVSMPEPDFRRYAYTVIKGACIDHIRRTSDGSKHGGSPGAFKPWRPAPGAIEVAQAMGVLPRMALCDGEIELVGRDPDPEQTLIRGEFDAKRAAALKLIDRLPERQREVLRRLLAGERAVDVAQHMRLTAARISQIRAAALERLRELIAAAS